MCQNIYKKFLKFCKLILPKIKPRFSVHYVAYTILFLALSFSAVRLLNVVHAAINSTPVNPGHPWSEIGYGNFNVTNNQNQVDTYTFPDASATVLTDHDLVTVAQGGSGVGTLTGILIGNVTSPFTAVALTAGQSIRMNSGGTAYEGFTPGAGTVTAVSVVSANGFAGSSSGGATPALTLSTTITGMLKGNGTAISAASAGSDYQSPLTFSTGLTNTTGTITANISTGLSGGQTIYGDTASGGNLTISSTSNATKGKILFGTSAYDEVNNRLGVGIVAPAYPLDVSGGNIHIVGSGGYYIGDEAGSLVGGGHFAYNATTNLLTIDGIKQDSAVSNLELLAYGGNVGIGAVPTQALSFSNSAAKTIWIENTANTVVGRALTIQAGSTLTAGTADMAGGNLILNSGLGKGTGASSIIFQTGRTLTTGNTLQTLTTAMTILGNGNVGIGTTLPGELLQIGDATENVTNRKALLFGVGGYAAPGAFGVASNGDKIIFYKGVDYDGRFGISAGAEVWTKSISTNADTTHGSLSYYTGNGSNALGLRMNLGPGGAFALGGTITAFNNYSGASFVGLTNGNVGIGTTAPTSLFQVTQPTAGVGTVTITGTTTCTGTGTQFLNTFKVGDSIIITATSETKVISAIASNTVMTIAAATNVVNSAYTLTGGTVFGVRGNGTTTINSYVHGLLIGADSALGSVGQVRPSAIIHGYFGGTDPNFISASMAILSYRNATTALGAGGFGSEGLYIGHSRSGTVGTPGVIVQNGDNLGAIMFVADDGVDFRSKAAYIGAQVDGVPGANDMPGRLVFGTTLDGTQDPVERMRITNGGNVGIGLTPTFRLDVLDTTSNLLKLTNNAALYNTTQITSIDFAGRWWSSSPTQNEVNARISALHRADGYKDGILTFSTALGGVTAEKMRINESGNVGIGTTTPLSKLSINGGLHVGGDSDAGDNNILADGTVTISGLTAGSAGNFVVNGGSGLLVTRTAAQVLSDIGAQATITNPVTGTGTQNYVTKWNNAGGTVIGDSLIFDDGSHIGIGTTTPRTALEIGAASNPDGSFLAIGTYSGAGSWIEPDLGAGTRMMWYPRKGAFRVGGVDGTQWNDVNIRDYSVAMGYNTTASSNNSFAMGYNTTASEYYSVAMGDSTTASGQSSFAMGANTIADSFSSFALGKYNVGGGDPVNWVAGDPLFEIGNGTSSTPSDALMVLKNGNVGIGTTSPQKILEINDNDSNTATSGFRFTNFVCTGNDKLTVGAGGDLVCATDQTGSGSGNTIDTLTDTLGAGNDANALDITNIGKLYTALGTAGAPAYSFYSDTDTGIWSSAGNILNFSTNGSEMMRIDSSGYVGIGTTAPTGLLEVNNGSHMGLFVDTVNNLYNLGYYDGADFEGVKLDLAGGKPVLLLGSGSVTGDGTKLVIDDTSHISYFESSNVGIGTPSPTSILQTVASGTKTTAYTGNLLTNITTSSTASIGKIGLDVESTGVWNGTSATNTGLVVNVTGGTTNYAATFSGGNIGIGTTTPRTELELGGDGAILATGTYTSGWTEPNLGAGTRMMWYPKSSAFRVGTVAGTQWNDANIGVYSTAIGLNTTASGGISTAMGEGTTASNMASTAMGEGTTASGLYSTATGYYTTANSNTSFALGRYNVGGGNDSAWVDTDPLFEIGNGTGTGVNAADALMVLKNGKVGIGDTNPGSILDVNGNLTLRDITGGGSCQSGSVLCNKGLDLYWNGLAVSTGGNSISGTTNYVARFSSANAVGIGSIFDNGKVGIGTTNPDYHLQVEADSNYQFEVVGKGTNYSGTILANIYSERTTTGTDALLKVGSAYAPNTLYVQDSGNVGIGTTSPLVALHVGSASVTDSTNLLELQDANSVCTFNANTGAPSCGSDLTLKKNINDQSDNLTKILALRPVTYNWLTDEDGIDIKHGFIAQEVAQIMPELVTDGTWIDGSTKKFLQTAGMTPYIVGAIKELNLKMEDLTDATVPFLDENNQKTFVGRFFDRMAVWAGDIGNGIENLYAKIVHTKKLCVADDSGAETCITKAELDALLVGAGSSGSNSGTGDSGSGGGSTPPSEDGGTGSGDSGTMPVVNDIVPPVITLNGDAIMNLNVGDSYSEMGATVIDNVDTEVAIIIIGSVDTSVAGTYTVTYTATDTAGNNTVPVVRTVVVTDTNPPSTELPTEPMP